MSKIDLRYLVQTSKYVHIQDELRNQPNIESFPDTADISI